MNIFTTNKLQGSFAINAIALVVVIIWGTTFVFTKVLMQAGLTPAHVFTLRFFIAYVLMACIFRRRWLCDSWKDETYMALMGITGGSVYFLAENSAMLYTTATNTSLIVCSCPLFTALLSMLIFRREKYSRWLLIGSVIACLGMSVVVLNGRFVLHLSPLGDALAFAACICWAVYSLLFKVMQNYPSWLITRKVFFYGLITIIPYYIYEPVFPDWSVLTDTTVILNTLFLAVIASLVCFLVWSWCIKKIGVVQCTNWVYFNPLSTMVAAYLVLSEQVTPWLLVGTLLILVGLWLSEKK